jgi:truncated hemoglobin YjbI
MSPNDTVPTVYEWAGGAEAFERLTAAFYERVGTDELVGPLFANMPANHPHHVALWLAWGTRIALDNSEPGAEPPPRAPVPRWGWGEAPPQG